MRHALCFASLFALLASPALAEDAALILGSERYERLDRVSRADDLLQARAGLEDLGFAVSALRNGRSGPTAEAVAEFVDTSADADRIVVLLSGHFATDGARTWFLTADANAPGLMNVDAAGVSVDSLLKVLAQTPGQAILVLGPSSLSGPDLDPWLRIGVGDLDIPQGVTVLRGLPRDVADFAEDALVTPGLDLAEELQDLTAIRASGYLPATWTPMPADEVAAQPELTPEPEPATDPAREDSAWRAAAEADTLNAYRAYLAAYPDGRYTAEAEAMIEEILTEPNRDARKAEEALSLTRDQRREIQRDLTILDYDTRGIDGIFGPGTRRAITNWQQQTGYSQTSYMTREQINRLDAQAARRAAELEAEAERQREEELRLDRAYWEETGAKGDEAGYRAYLGRYPDGVYSEIASSRLAQIEEENRAAAEADDREAWDRAVAANTVASYRDYLDIWPNGVFRDEAQARINAMISQQNSAADVEAAEAAERRLGLNPITARLVEARLAQLGLNPGVVDGRFDDDTRRALRRYQRARNLTVTGYLNEATVVRLLADNVRVDSR